MKKIQDNLYYVFVGTAAILKSLNRDGHNQAVIATSGGRKKIAEEWARSLKEMKVINRKEDKLKHRAQKRLKNINGANLSSKTANESVARKLTRCYKKLFYPQAGKVEIGLNLTI